MPIIADAWDCLLNRLKNGGLSQFRRMKKIDGKIFEQTGHCVTQKNKLRELEKELKRKDKALAEAAALLILREKVQCPLGQQRGRLPPLPERHKNYFSCP
ncbi:hypothetical protein ABR759_04520 [Escherichia coli]